MAGFLQYLINQGKSQLALEIARIFLNWYNVKAVYAAYNRHLPNRNKEEIETW
jgi:hypothetical protein